MSSASPLVATVFGQHRKFPAHARKTSGSQGRDASLRCLLTLPCSSSEAQGQSVGPGEKARQTFSSTGSFARTWKLSSRLFSRPDWLPLGLRGCPLLCPLHFFSYPRLTLRAKCSICLARLINRPFCRLAWAVGKHGLDSGLDWTLDWTLDCTLDWTLDSIFFTFFWFLYLFAKIVFFRQCYVGGYT